MVEDEEPPAPRAAREKLIANETTKLLATTVNNVATAFLVAGVVAPLVGIRSTAFESEQAALSAVWLLAGVILHLSARLVLRGLQS